MICFGNSERDKYKPLSKEGGKVETAASEKDEKIQPKDGLQSVHILAYSVGHFCNDLCASMWFVYLTWYIKNVVKLSKTVTALSILSGQLADGFMTPIVGVLSDKFNGRFGKRTPWYIFGTLLVIPTFLGIYSYPSFINECTGFFGCKANIETK